MIISNHIKAIITSSKAYNLQVYTMTTKAEQPKAKPRARKVKEKEINPVVMDIPVQSETKAKVPMLRDAKGTELSLSVENIQSLGSDVGQSISKLSDQVLSRVKVADTGELGEGISNILSLTRKVDISKLGKKETGLVARVWNIFGSTQQKVMEQFDTSADQIEKISTTLTVGIDRMRGESQWLQDTYAANIEYLYELEDILENIESVKTVQDEKLDEIVKNEDVAIEVLEEQRMICDALDKQADKLRRLIQLSKLTAPQIASMRGVNINTIEKFKTLTDVVIPAWKNNMSLGLISLQQSKDNELSKLVDDETNRLLVDNAKNVAANMKEAAKAAQRGVVDLESLRAIQNSMIAGINDTIAIEKKGKEDRRLAATELEKMDDELKTALRAIANKKSEM